jgi:hypothetical protein
MHDKIKVVYDYIGPNGPLNNYRNSESTTKTVSRDFHINELFNEAGGYCISSTSQLKETDYFIYPIKLELQDDHWIKNPSADLFYMLNGKILNYIKNSNGYLLLHMWHENGTHPCYQRIHNYFKDIIPFNKIIFQVGNYSAKEFYKLFCEEYNIPESDMIQIVHVNFFEYFVGAQTLRKSYASNQVINSLEKNINYSKIQKTFLSLNNRLREHRVDLFLLFNQHDLLKDSLFTIKEPKSDSDWYSRISQYFIDKYKITNYQLSTMRNMLPLKYDLDSTHENHIAYLSTDMNKLHNQTLISVVTETTFNRDIFFTEKIFKPIAYRQPFILVSSYKSLAYLKSLGYKTFSEFFDESYDNIIDNNERLIRIVELCVEINNWSDADKKKFFYKTMPVSQYNFELLQSRGGKMQVDFWYDFINKIK